MATIRTDSSPERLLVCVPREPEVTLVRRVLELTGLPAASCASVEVLAPPEQTAWTMPAGLLPDDQP